MPSGRDRFHLAVIGLASLALQLPIFDRWLPYFDEGFIYQIADEIRHGAVMYRDVAHVAFPGVFYLMAAVFWLVGPSVLAGRVVAILLFTIAAGLVYRLARTVLSEGWALAAALLFVLHRPWAFPQWQMVHYSTLAVTMLLLAAGTLARRLPAASVRDFATTGVLLGLAVLCKQDYAGMVLVGTNVFLLCSGRATRTAGGRLIALAALDGGMAAVLVSVFGAFWWAGALPQMITQCLVAPLVVQKLWTPGAGEYITFFGLRPWFHQNPTLHSVQAFNYLPPLLLDLYFAQALNSWVFRETIVVDVLLKVVFLGPLIVIALQGLRLMRRADRDATWIRELWITVFALSLLLSYNKPRDWAHLVPVATPMFVLLPVLLARVTSGRRRTVLLAVPAAATAVLAVAGCFLLVGFRHRYATHVDTPRAGIQLEASEARVLHDLSVWLDANVPAGAAVPAYPYHPSINFLLGRPGVGRFRTIEPVAGAAGRDDDVIAAFDRTSPPAVVFSLKEMVSSPRFSAYAPRLHAYLLAHYELGPVFSCAEHRCILGVLTRRAPRDERVLRDLAAAVPDANAAQVAAGRETALTGDARDGVVAVTEWSYLTPVVALRPLPDAATLRLAFPVPPSASRFRARAGVNPHRWAEFEPGRTELGVSRRDARGEQVLWQASFDPERDYDDRAWRDVDVAVDAGTPDAQLILWVRTDRPSGYPLEHAGFAAPRLVQAAP